MSDIRISAKGLQMLLRNERLKIAEQISEQACGEDDCACCLRAYESVIKL